MADRLSTGVEPLDRALDGGVRSGSLVAVRAAPEAQSGPLLRVGMGERPTQYVTTVLSERTAREMLAETANDVEYTVTAVDVEGPLAGVRDALGDLDEPSNVVVDVVNPLESRTDEADYLAFLNDLRETLAETGSVGYLHCLEAEPPTAHRELTLAAASMVWELDVETEGDRIEFYLEIPKARAMDPEDRVLHLELGRGIDVDTSRDIA